jgi:hypothetical protein
MPATVKLILQHLEVVGLTALFIIAATGSLAGTITLDAQGNPDTFSFKFDGTFVTFLHILKLFWQMALVVAIFG